MPNRNHEIAEKLERIGQLYQIKNDRWRSTTYLNAARLVRNVADIEQVDVKTLTGIGDSVAKCIHQILASGTCDKLIDLGKDPDTQALELTKIQGIGPKTAMKLAKELGINSIAKLEEALQNGRLTNQAWLDAIAFSKKQHGRLGRGQVEPLVAKLLSELSMIPGTLQVEPAGSFRRKLPTVKDVDILISTENSTKAMEAFAQFGQVINSGERKSSINAHEIPIRVDLLVVEPKCWGSALCYFTGSKEHNVRLRADAKARGMLVNEYGIFRGDGQERIGGELETDLYRILGIPFTLPEDRVT